MLHAFQSFAVPPDGKKTWQNVQVISQQFLNQGNRIKNNQKAEKPDSSKEKHV